MTTRLPTTIGGHGPAAGVWANPTGPRPSPRLVDSRTHLYPRTQDLMGFDLKDGGFHIVLSREVPERLRGQVRPLVEALLGAHALSLPDIKFTALHPGGRRILENVEQELGVRGLTQPSWDILRRYGNLSSATVLFVLDSLVGRPPAIEPGDYGLLAAFGPGFSCELSLLRWDV
jgi:alkylresorcinol/alkylpyrone synthase